MKPFATTAIAVIFLAAATDAKKLEESNLTEAINEEYLPVLAES